MSELNPRPGNPIEKFHREKTPTGMLYVHPNYINLTQRIKVEIPWLQQGNYLGGSRGCFLTRVGEFKLVRKPKRKGSITGYRIALGERKDQEASKFRIELSAFIEMKTLETAKRRYLSRFNQKLPVEQLVATYMDGKSGKFLFYLYELNENEQIIPWKNLSKKLERQARKWYSDIRRNLLNLGIEPKDSDILVIQDNATKNIRFVIVDTERWQLAEEGKVDT